MTRNVAGAQPQGRDEVACVPIVVVTVVAEVARGAVPMGTAKDRVFDTSSEQLGNGPRRG